MVDAITHTVTATVVRPDRVGVSGLRAQIVDKNVGQDVLPTEMVTDGRAMSIEEVNSIRRR